jgi:gas vesicle protein
MAAPPTRSMFIDVGVGVSRRDLAVIFHMNREEIRNLTHGLQPIGEKQTGTRDALFDLGAAASLIVAPKLDTEVIERLMRTKPEQLPDKLKKEFWGAKEIQQRVETAAGDLWPSTKVVEYMGDAYKILRLSLQLITDAVEREAGLSEVQRRIIQELVDTALNDMRERLQGDARNKRNAEKRRSVARKEDAGSDDTDL